MSGNRQRLLFIFLHHGRIADNVSEKNSSELAVLFLHNYPVKNFSTSGYFNLKEQS